MFLTDDGEEEGVAHGRRGGDLALVEARVLALRVPDAQRPVLGVRRVHRLEALVRRVRVAAHGEQVDVPVPHPRHLQQATTTTTITL